MKYRLFKRLLTGLLIVFLLCCLLMVTPRVWSAINSDKPPVGYHYLAPTYLALKLGLEEMINKTPAIPADIEEIKNIEYKNINGKSLQLDLYKPRNLTKPAPLLVFIHGGGWSGGERADYLVYLVAFAKKGYVTATVSYRLLKDGPYPACAEDITDAVQWFYKNGETYGYDPDRIALIGGSAGAHLALLAAYGWKKTGMNSDSTVADTIPRIKAVVDIYGPTDLTTEFSRDNSTVTSFLAHTYQQAPELFTEASPIHYLNKNSPPTMILHGTSDQTVPISQSDLLKSKLDSLGVPTIYYKVPLWPHTMDIIQRVNRFSADKMTGFFEKYLN
ncbi:MAG: alpha/beta hydrolase [Mariniphaga sp.]|nr:alpha/beta hydrolase [Mariniphaga sp.]